MATTALPVDEWMWVAITGVSTAPRSRPPQNPPYEKSCSAAPRRSPLTADIATIASTTMSTQFTPADPCISVRRTRFGPGDTGPIHRPVPAVGRLASRAPLPGVRPVGRELRCPSSTISQPTPSRQAVPLQLL